MNHTSLFAAVHLVLSPPILLRFPTSLIFFFNVPACVSPTHSHRRPGCMLTTNICQTFLVGFVSYSVSIFNDFIYINSAGDTSIPFLASAKKIAHFLNQVQWRKHVHP
jgi:hypothetical protein